MVGGGWKIALLLKQLKILQSLARPASKFLFEFPRRGSRRWEPLVSSAVSNQKNGNGRRTAKPQRRRLGPRPTQVGVLGLSGWIRCCAIT